MEQEPKLFNGTVFENIAYGLVGTKWEKVSRDEQMVQVEKAAKFAFAHDFISGLPQGYDTPIGERGGLLSGGQKQRVAIARSIVSEPKVLLLDEATSALDPQAEGIVQKALDNVSRDRTTIVIAHKLATIKDADNIVVMAKGSILEQGTHDSLLASEGPYYRLVKAQSIVSQVADEPSDSNTVASSDDDAGKKDAELDVTRTLTRYETTARQRLESLRHRDDFSKYKHLGIVSSIWGMIRRTPELKLQYMIVFWACVAGGKSTAPKA